MAEVLGLQPPDIEVRYVLQYLIDNDGDELWINYGVARTPEATQAALAEMRELNNSTIKDWRAVKVETIRQPMDW